MNIEILIIILTSKKVIQIPALIDCGENKHAL